MALPIVEFVVAPATEAFRADPRDTTVTGPLLEIMKSCEGMISTTLGLQDEDKASAYIAVVWRSMDDHKALMNDPAKYPQVGKALQAVVDVQAISMFHCTFKSEPYKALQAPVTEMVTITLQKGQSKDTLEELVEELAQLVDAAPPESGAVSAAWGPTVEKDDVVFLAIGWTSVEAHWTLVRARPDAQAVIEKVKAIATVDVKHVALA